MKAVVDDTPNQGKTPETSNQVLSIFGLGHGQASAIAQVILNAEEIEASPEDQ